MIAVVDYGAGNLFSVSNALSYLSIPHVITSDPAKIEAADGDAEDTPLKSEQEARFVAGRIAQMLREGAPVQTADGLRACRPGDFRRAEGG